MSQAEPKNADEAAQPTPVLVHGYFVPADMPAASGAVGWRQILAKVGEYRWILTAAILLGLVSAVAWTIWGERRYAATALVRVVEPDDFMGGLGDLAGSFGGLAAIAGFKLPTGNYRTEALAILRSKSLAETFITREQLMPGLFPGRWEPAARKWRDPEDPPTMEEAIKRFDRKVRAIEEDKLTGLIRVSVQWRNPALAARWSNELVRLANERMRQRAIDEANRSMTYLRREVEQTNNIELQRAIYTLMQDRLNEATLANARVDYALQIIDPARAPDADDPVWPRLSVMLFLGLLVGTLLGALAAFAVDRIRQQRH